MVNQVFSVGQKSDFNVQGAEKLDMWFLEFFIIKVHARTTCECV